MPWFRVQTFALQTARVGVADKSAKNQRQQQRHEADDGQDHVL